MRNIELTKVVRGNVCIKTEAHVIWFNRHTMDAGVCGVRFKLSILLYTQECLVTSFKSGVVKEFFFYSNIVICCFVGVVMCCFCLFLFFCLFCLFLFGGRVC